MNKENSNPQQTPDFNSEILNRSWANDSPLPPIDDKMATAELPPLNLGQTAELPFEKDWPQNAQNRQQSRQRLPHSERNNEHRSRRRPVAAKAKSPYRNLALVIAGLFIYALLIGVASFILGSVIYNNNADAADYQTAPLIIFIGAVFLSSFMITLFSRGGTIFPSFALALLICLSSILLSGGVEPSLGSLFLKFGLSILIVIISFSAAKAFIILRKKA